MVRDNQSELYAKQQSLLTELRSIVGNKKLEFSDAYIKARKGEYHRLGSGMVYYGVTRQSVMCPCRVVYSNDPLNKEYGAYIKKYSLYKYFDGQNVKKIALEDLFVKDLEKVVEDIKFFLYWEANVHFPQIKKEYDECIVLKEKYGKILEKEVIV
jgi:signal recognition particle subunit SEC65